MRRDWINKTGRERGAILALIRKIAASKKTFTVDDLVPPLDHKQADSNCFNLMRRGEIKKLSRGRAMGGWVKRAVYQKTKMLRKPELTNEQL